MSGTIESRLEALGIVLPNPPKPSANYLPFAVSGSIVFLAGVVCQRDGEVAYAGKVERNLDLETAKKAARLCAVNLLANLRLACDGDLDRVVRCLRLNGYVNASPDFTHVPRVVDGASDLMVEVFGDRGRHARTAIGVAVLPRDAAVEVDAIFEIRP